VEAHVRACFDDQAALSQKLKQKAMLLMYGEAGCALDRKTLAERMPRQFDFLREQDREGTYVTLP
jgi:hypothetical protein